MSPDVKPSEMKRFSPRLLWRDVTVAVLYLAGESAGGVPNQAAERDPVLV